MIGKGTRGGERLMRHGASRAPGRRALGRTIRASPSQTKLMPSVTTMEGKLAQMHKRAERRVKATAAEDDGRAQQWLGGQQSR